jgi:serine O-acetyltransferase
VSGRLGDRLAELVERVVNSYALDTRTHYIDREYLPSRSGIMRLCDDLLELTYPGYIGRHGLNRHNVAYHVGEMIPKLWESMRTQISNCLCHDAELADQDTAPCAQMAETLATEFIERIPEVRQLLSDDVQAHYDGDPAAVSPSEIILAYPGILAITLHRYAHVLYRRKIPYMPRIMSEYAHQRTGIDIHPGAVIGRSFCIDHGTGVVIGETAEIGDNAKIYQGVTLGALSFPKDERGRVIRGYKRHPTVGNNVTIYANAIILGGDTVIGDGAVVGGSVFIAKSVAPGHQVSLAPPILRVRPPRPPAPTPGDQPWSDYAI